MNFFSNIGQKLTARSGILQLMDDLGRAMAEGGGGGGGVVGGGEMLMLGGGTPALVPEVEALWRNRMVQLLAEGDAFDRMLGVYDPPQGSPRFVRAFAELMRKKFAWRITEKNVAVTNGTQSTFFFLFTLLAGLSGDGKRRRILLPLSPEYVGYADQGLEEGIFVSCPPKITWPKGEAARLFKYEIDFAAVENQLRAGDIAAMAISRPTNPSGNMITAEELQKLEALADRFGVYLIIDCAYGLPFPGLVFVDAELRWSPRTIHTFSLSKLGLPGVRTGIVVAPPEIIEAVTAMVAIVGLANGNVGQQLVLPLVESGEILDIGPKLLRPFYTNRRTAALAAVRENFDAAGVDWALHENEGAFFLWLWLRGLKITTTELYERLKEKKVLVVPGEYFFFGLEASGPPWAHRQECLRISYAQPAEVVREGIRRTADTAREFTSA